MKVRLWYVSVPVLDPICNILAVDLLHGTLGTRASLEEGPLQPFAMRTIDLSNERLETAGVRLVMVASL